MAELREALGAAGLEEVRTYLQSGNVILRSRARPAALEARLQALIAERFAIEVAVIVRTGEELHRVVEHDPLPAAAQDPKRYQVTFLAHELDQESLAGLRRLASPSERLVARDREIYSWHPDGVARSRLWAGLAGDRLGVTATARNWSTVTNLDEMLQDE